VESPPASQRVPRALLDKLFSLRRKTAASERPAEERKIYDRYKVLTLSRAQLARV